MAKRMGLAKDSAPRKSATRKSAAKKLPAKKTPAKKAAKAAAADEVAAQADADGHTADGEPEEPEFLNRAARRAKGRGRESGQQPVSGHGPTFAGRSGGVPGQRQWGNRRTGG